MNHVFVFVLAVLDLPSVVLRRRSLSPNDLVTFTSNTVSSTLRPPLSVSAFNSSMMSPYTRVILDKVIGRSFMCTGTMQQQDSFSGIHMKY